MPGNSKRPGAVRKRQGGNPTAGSGGRRRKGLEGKGATPKAKDRVGHKANRENRQTQKRTSSGGGKGSGRSQSRRRSPAGPEWVAGRNSVVEALEAQIPVTTLYVADHVERDDRLRTAFRLAAERHISLLEVSRAELDKMTDDAVHQGLAMKVPRYDYADPSDLVTAARDAGQVPLVVALDSITDPRNLGAVVRSAGAFGAHGVVVPERRAAGMTAAAWKASAGAAARVPVARATNLTRQLEAYKSDGLMVAGLDSDGGVDVADVELVTEPLVLVVGSEGKGLSRLVRATCDVLTHIPMADATESLNAGVATGIALYEIDRRRTTHR
ncbi:MAG: 23S rRNA (guanosine(2251)-2'-O)-methyltransferase RlmB [Nocardioidaceae bacterium]